MRRFRYFFMLACITVLTFSTTIISYAYWVAQTEKKSNTFTIQELNMNLKIAWCDYPYGDDSEGSSDGTTVNSGNAIARSVDVSKNATAAPVKVTIVFDVSDIVNSTDADSLNTPNVLQFVTPNNKLLQTKDGATWDRQYVLQIDSGTSLADGSYVLPRLIYKGVEYNEWYVSNGNDLGANFDLNMTVNSSMFVSIKR